MVDNIMLFPNCDLHMTLNPATSLPLRVVRQQSGSDPTQPYSLSTVKHEDCVFDWFRPYDTPGHRLDNPPMVADGDNKTTTVVLTATKPGIYLFQLRIQGVQYLVGRLQVHQQALAWWFGNDSITTARDGSVAHAQPSLYAQFSDDKDTGVDVVGDITGHGYVSLDSTDKTTFTIAPQGRLLGLKATTATDPNLLPKVTGTWPALGTNNTVAGIPVRVVDYAVNQPALKTVRSPGGVQGYQNKNNIVFLSEGFGPNDEKLFTRLVKQATDEIFSKPRHEPYHLLEKSFNVFQAFTPSTQRTITCGFTVKETDDDVKVPRGTPLPMETSLGLPGSYPMNQLIHLVGLPRRNDPTTVAEILQQWKNQGLPGTGPLDLDLNRVDEDTVLEWRKHRTDGILNAQDTFFGLHTGGRLGDRFAFSPPVPPVDKPNPANPDDEGEKATRTFMHQLYEFFRPQSPDLVAVHFDRRRHPPELYAFINDTNPNTTVVRYLGGLKLPQPTGAALPIGQEWVPNDNVFQRSRGHVVILVLDTHDMGQNINLHSMMALSALNAPTLAFERVGPGNRQLRRKPPDEIVPNVEEIINTVAHELGHSFNLDDEYELVDRADPLELNGSFPGTEDLKADNLTHFNFITANDPGDATKINPDKVKWLAVPRTFLSSRMVAPSQDNPGGGLRIPIDRNDVGKWMQISKRVPAPLVSLRIITYDKPPTKQLPQPPGQLLTPLAIAGFDPTGGAVIVTGPGIPPATPIPAGSLLWVPDGGPTGKTQLLAVDSNVLTFLKKDQHPLNKDPDNVHRSGKKDDPKDDIPGFKAPCDGFQVIGVYEGAKRFAAKYYRPAGGCKMRDQSDTDEHGGAFCFICKWLIVNRVDPGMHAFLNIKLYPTAKTGDDG